MLQCVINVSEGRDLEVLADLADSARPALLDVHRDSDHNRAVFTLAGAEVEDAARRLARQAVARIDIGAHQGAHPRLGALDVVPWVHLTADPRHRLRDGSLAVAAAARDRFALWAGAHLDLPCFLYGPAGLSRNDRSLPDLRRQAWRPLAPDTGPSHPHPTAGAACVGARPVLVAYNLWLAGRISPRPAASPGWCARRACGPSVCRWATRSRSPATSLTPGPSDPRLPSMPSPVWPR